MYWRIEFAKLGRMNVLFRSSNMSFPLRVIRPLLSTAAELFFFEERKRPHLLTPAFGFYSHQLLSPNGLLFCFVLFFKIIFMVVSVNDIVNILT